MAQYASDNATNPQYGEEIIEGVVETIKKDPKGIHKNRIHILEKNGGIRKLEDVFVVGAVEDYLREGFEGKIYAARPVHSEITFIAGLETKQGNKISDEKERQKGLRQVKSLTTGYMIKTGLACIAVMLFVLIVMGVTAGWAYIAGAAISGYLGALGASFGPNLVRDTIDYPGLGLFMKQNGLDGPEISESSEVQTGW